MKRINLKILLIAIILVSPLGCSHGNPDAGKPPPDKFSLIERIGNKQKTIRYEAYEELLAKGPDAVPEIVEGLKHKNPGIRKACATLPGKLGPDAVEAVPALVEALDDEFTTIGDMAATSLGKIGPGAIDAVPALMNSFIKDNFNRNKAIERALVGIGPGVVPYIVTELQNPPDQGSLWLIRAIKDIGPDASPALEPLVDFIRTYPDYFGLYSSSNPTIAGEALAEVDPEKSVRLLAEILTDDDESDQVKDSIVEVIACMGDVSVKILPAILQTAGKNGIGNINGLTQELLTYVLNHYGDESKEILLGSLGDESPDVRMTAAQIIGADPVLTFEALLKLRNMADNDPDERVRAAAKDAIARLREKVDNN